MSTDEWREVEWPKRQIERLDAAYGRLVDKLETQIDELLDELLDRVAALGRTSMITDDRLSALEEPMTYSSSPKLKITDDDSIPPGYGVADENDTRTPRWAIPSDYGYGVSLRQDAKARDMTEAYNGLSEPKMARTMEEATAGGVVREAPLNHGVTTWGCRFDDQKYTDHVNFISHLRGHLDELQDRHEADQAEIAQIRVNGDPQIVLALAERRVRQHLDGAFSEYTIEGILAALRGTTGTTAQSPAEQAESENSDE